MTCVLKEKGKYVNGLSHISFQRGIEEEEKDEEEGVKKFSRFFGEGTSTMFSQCSPSHHSRLRRLQINRKRERVVVGRWEDIECWKWRELKKERKEKMEKRRERRKGSIEEGCEEKVKKKGRR